MNETAVTQYIIDRFDGVETAATDGYTFFFYGSDRKLPFATIATRDNEFDRASHLDRPSVFRVNIGIGRDTFRSLFGGRSSRPGDEGVVGTGHDFTVLDRLLPHPVYAPQSWVCVLNPGDATFETVRPLIAEAYDLAVVRARRRAAAQAGDVS